MTPHRRRLPVAIIVMGRRRQPVPIQSSVPRYGASAADRAWLAAGVRVALAITAGVAVRLRASGHIEAVRNREAVPGSDGRYHLRGR